MLPSLSQRGNEHFHNGLHVSVLTSAVMQSLQAWLLSVSDSSLGEREDWFHTLSRAIADHAAGLNTFSCSSEV